MDFTISNLQIIGVDCVKGICSVGKIEETKTGFKLVNKSLFRIMSQAIPYAIQSLGEKAELTIKNNVIMSVHTIEENQYIERFNQSKAAGFKGLVVDSVNAVTHIIKLRHPVVNPIIVLCYCAPKVQKYVLPLSGAECIIYISTNEQKVTERNRTVIGLTPYE